MCSILETLSLGRTFIKVNEEKLRHYKIHKDSYEKKQEMNDTQKEHSSPFS